MKTILIVDDTFENLYLLKVIIEEAGYIAVEAKDGKEGLEKLHEYNVDLIISDILMPVMDGYLFCQACKKNKLFKNIPFVFYTSTYTEALDEDFALKLGAVQFLRKPADQNKILSVIEGVFSEINSEQKPVKNEKFTEEEVLKLYSKRLISKLENKNLELEKEVVEREKAEQLLIHKNQILDLIAVNTPLSEIFDRLILNYQSVHPDYYGSISLMDEDGVHLNLSSSPSLPRLYSLAVKRLAVGENVGSCGTAAFTGKTVVVSDISTDPLWIDYKHIALRYNLNSCWSIPIFSEEKVVVGTFAIYSKSINTPSLSDIRELNFTLNLVNIAIEKFRIVEEIKRKDESYKALIDQASDSIVTYSLEGTIYDFNKAAYKNLGYTEEEFLKLKIQDINVGEIIQDQDNLQKILNGEAIISIRKFKCKDKSLVDVEISSKLRKDGRVVAIARDITERKKAELKLLESEYNLRQSQIIGNIGSYVVDIKEKTWESSIVLNRIFGINKSYVKTDESWIDIIHPDERERVLGYFEDCVLNNKKINIEYKAVKVDSKEEIWVHARGEFLFDDDANPIKIIGTTQDITERKNAEVKLRESEYNLRQSQIIGNIGSYAIDLGTGTWEGSLLLYHIFGINKTYAKTMESWGERVHPEEKEVLLSYFENCVVNNKKFNKEYRVLKLDSKEEIWVHGIGELVFDKDANPIKMIGTIQDITHRKHSELKLQESEKSLLVAQKVAKIGSFKVDSKSLLGNTSVTFKDIIGVDHETVVDFDLWKSIVYPADRSLIKENVFKSKKLKKKFDLEYRIITKNKKN